MSNFERLYILLVSGADSTTRQNRHLFVYILADHKMCHFLSNYFSKENAKNKQQLGSSNTIRGLRLPCYEYEIFRILPIACIIMWELSLNLISIGHVPSTEHSSAPASFPSKSNNTTNRKSIKSFTICVGFLFIRYVINYLHLLGDVFFRLSKNKI